MNTSSAETKRRPYLRFSLGMLLALVSCVCCWLAGRIGGHRQGVAEMMEKLPTFTKTYYLGDFTDVKSAADLNRYIARIERECYPAVWTASKKSTISMFPLNNSIIVSTAQIVHEDIANMLSRLRREDEIAHGETASREVARSSP